MKNKNYIQIQGWMINELKLKSNALILYAVIYGFSQDQDSEFTGSIDYLCRASNCTRNTVKKALNSLVELGYIIKRIQVVNNVQFNRYKVSVSSVNVNSPGGSILDYPGGSETGCPGGSEIAPNNTIIYNTNKINTSSLKEDAFFDKENPIAYEAIFKSEEWFNNVLMHLKSEKIKTTPETVLEIFNHWYKNKKTSMDLNFPTGRLRSALLSYTTTVLKNGGLNKSNSQSNQQIEPVRKKKIS